MSGDVAERFVQAIADHDRGSLEALLASDIDFRGLTPGRAWEARSPVDVVDVLLGNWFEDSDHIEAVTRLERGDDVGDVQRVGYRFDLSNDAGLHTVEQQAYYRVRDGRLSYLRILCSGFRPRVTR
jgi:hypothetical protein